MDDQTLVRVLKALADRSRIRMVREIARAGELSCGRIGARFHLAQPTISHHLKILADSGLLIVRREGQHAMMSVNRELLTRAVAFLSVPLRATPARPAQARPRKQRRSPASRR